MIGALVCGAGAGTGLLLTARGLAPRRASLAESLAALRHTPTPAPPPSAEVVGLAGRVTRPAADALTARLPGLIRPSLRRDLLVLGRSPQRQLAEKLTLAFVGLLLFPAMAAVLTVGGIRVGWALPLWAALVAGSVGFFIPDLGARSQAAGRRTDFRHALSAFLDLVVIGLAGGGGVETALTDAAGIGQGWAFEQIRRALAGAHLSRTTPWAALARLGTELGIAELTELAATVGLAGAEGAKVRASLSAKAASLRAHQLAEADGAARATTERMSLPVVLLFAAFLLFIGYPAVSRVLTGI